MMRASVLEIPGEAARSVKVKLLSPGALAGLEPQWTALAANSAEPNPFLSPYLFLPALRLAPPDLKVACAFDDRHALIGLAPLVPGRGYARLPVAYVETFMHPHCFFGAPLVRIGLEEAVFSALFEAAEAFSGVAFLRLNLLDTDGPLIAAAESAAEKSGRSLFRWRPFERAMLKSALAANDYLDGMRAKKRKELRRQRRRLGEEGALTFRRLDDEAELPSWTDAFLALESAGWKGNEGTALDSAPASAAFFREGLERAFAARTLRFYRLDLEGVPVAMIVNFIERGCGYSFKIAHDEAFARFSPGVLLEIEMMQALDGETIEFFDSCARPDHPMIESLWRERRKMTSLHVSLNGGWGEAQLKAGALIERLAETVKRRNTAVPSADEADGDL